MYHKYNFKSAAMPWCCLESLRYLHHHETLRGIFSERWAYLRWQNGSDSKNMFQFVSFVFSLVSLVCCCCCWSRYFCFMATTIWEHLTFVYTFLDVFSFSVFHNFFFLRSIVVFVIERQMYIFFLSLFKLEITNSIFFLRLFFLFFILVSSSTRLSICFVCFFFGGEREIQMPQFKRKKKKVISNATCNCMEQMILNL